LPAHGQGCFTLKFGMKMGRETCLVLFRRASLI
jgi:hypothetical protein